MTHSPRYIAKCFAEMDDFQQAEFFEGVWRETEKWKVPASRQWNAMYKQIEKSPKALEAFTEITQEIEKHSNETVKDESISQKDDASLVFPVMSLREWFAGQALSGITAGYWGNAEMSGLSPQNISDAAYQQADAMLKARNDE